MWIIYLGNIYFTDAPSECHTTFKHTLFRLLFFLLHLGWIQNLLWFLLLVCSYQRSHKGFSILVLNLIWLLILYFLHVSLFFSAQFSTLYWDGWSVGLSSIFMIFRYPTLYISNLNVFDNNLSTSIIYFVFLEVYTFLLVSSWVCHLSNADIVNSVDLLDVFYDAALTSFSSILFPTTSPAAVVAFWSALCEEILSASFAKLFVVSRNLCLYLLFTFLLMSFAKDKNS